MSDSFSCISGARRTVAAPFTVSGVGIHTGAVSQVTIHPSSEGVAFRTGGQILPAKAAQVIDTSRCTVLGTTDRSATVSTVEHLLSAFAGLGITDARIEIEGPEIPIGDGSAAPWVEAVANAGGTVALSENGPVVAPLPQPIVVTGKNGSFLAAYPSETLRLTVAAAFDHPLVGTQVARFEPARGSDYARDVAPARTFGFIEEVEALQKAGLALGGSLDNAVVVYPDRYSSPLRLPEELAYHKLLDVLGDLYLALGMPPRGWDIVAVKPSHRLNVELAMRLRDAIAPGN